MKLSTYLMEENSVALIYIQRNVHDEWFGSILNRWGNLFRLTLAVVNILHKQFFYTDRASRQEWTSSYPTNKKQWEFNIFRVAFIAVLWLYFISHIKIRCWVFHCWSGAQTSKSGLCWGSQNGITIRSLSKKKKKHEIWPVCELLIGKKKFF